MLQQLPKLGAPEARWDCTPPPPLLQTDKRQTRGNKGSHIKTLLVLGRIRTLHTGNNSQGLDKDNAGNQQVQSKSNKQAKTLKATAMQNQHRPSCSYLHPPKIKKSP